MNARVELPPSTAFDEMPAAMPSASAVATSAKPSKSPSGASASSSGARSCSAFGPAIIVNAAAIPTPASFALATPPATFVVVPSSRADSAIAAAPTFARSSMNASDSWPSTRIEKAPSTATSLASLPVSVTFRTSVCTSASIAIAPAASMTTRSSMYERA
jgi:hypothetical protein